MRKFLVGLFLGLGLLGAVAQQGVVVGPLSFTLGSTAITLGTTTTTIAGLTLTAPTIGVATATSVNKVTITAPATSATLTITDGQTLSYVEGTWTPAITTDGTVGTPAYSVQVGTYEKVGRQVTARFDIQLSGWTGTPTGNISISGLPVTSTSTANDFGHCFVGTYLVTGLAALSYGITGRVVVNGTTAAFGQNATTGGGPAVTLTAAQVGTTGILQGACFYRTN